MKHNGTGDQIINMRLICEIHIEHNKNVYCCFIDYNTTLGCVDFELMWTILLFFGIPKYLVHGVPEKPLPKSDSRGGDSKAGFKYKWGE